MIFFTSDPNISILTSTGSISLSLLFFRLDPDNKKAEDAMKMVESINESELDVTTMEMHEPRNRSSMEVDNELAVKNLKTALYF